MISPAAIWAVAAKERMTLLRDHTVVTGIILQSVLLTIIFGYAVKSEVRSVSWVVYDADRTRLSRELVDGIAASRAVDRPARVASYGAVEDLFRRGDATAAIVIPPGFARAIERGERSPVQLLLNGASPLVALRFAGQAGPFLRRFHAEGTALRSELAPHRAGEPAIVLGRRYRFNPRLSDEWFFVPTIPAILLTQLFFGLACFSIVGERERGTYEHLLALPLRPAEILIGKALPFFAIGYVSIFVHFGIASVLFGIEVRGSFPALALASLLFFATSYAIAAFFSSIARNVHQAIYLTVFSVLPSTVISGFLVPTSTMPRPIQVAALFFPATHFVTILRAIVVRGAALADVAAPLGALGAIFGVVLVLLLALFPRRPVA